jgi:hypothetical protein
MIESLIDRKLPSTLSLSIRTGPFIFKILKAINQTSPDVNIGAEVHGCDK